MAAIGDGRPMSVRNVSRFFADGNGEDGLLEDMDRTLQRKLFNETPRWALRENLPDPPRGNDGPSLSQPPDQKHPIGFRETAANPMTVSVPNEKETLGSDHRGSFPLWEAIICPIVPPDFGRRPLILENIMRRSGGPKGILALPLFRSLATARRSGLRRIRLQALIFLRRSFWCIDFSLPFAFWPCNCPLIPFQARP